MYIYKILSPLIIKIHEDTDLNPERGGRTLCLPMLAGLELCYDDVVIPVEREAQRASL